MTVALVMCAGGRAANPVAAVESVLPLIDSYHIVDTGGMSDDTRATIDALLAGIEGEIVDEAFDGTGPSFTRALARAEGSADWLLHLHSDEVADVFPTMKEWLDADESPDTDAFMVEIVNPNLVHRLPRLLRGNREWRYVGFAHEYLEVDHSRTRPLLGLTLNHYGWSDPSKFEWVVEQLAEGRAAGEPRATFYTAEALRDLGRTDEAIVAYRERVLQGGWEEERWYAKYQAAKLSQDIDGLLAAWRERPYRHEPLTAAGRIVAARDNPDVLFNEAI